MQLNNTVNVKQEHLEKAVEFLQWKLANNSLNISDVKLSKYLEVTLEDAQEILLKLFEMKALRLEVTANCPMCYDLFTVEDISAAIECQKCDTVFIPEQNKRLVQYSYLINEKCKIFVTTKERPAISIASRILQGGNMYSDKKKVFLSYCHVDEDYKKKLDKHLAPLKRIGSIDSWNDRKIEAGAPLDATIEEHLRKDDIIILLISADFISSDYCYEKEMKTALERCEKGQCKIIPVIVRPCLWKVTPLGQFLALPQDGKPILEYENEDSAYLEIAATLHDMIENW